MASATSIQVSLGKRMRQVFSTAALLLAFAACAWTLNPCLAEPAVAHYFEQLTRAVYAKWNPPADGKVEVILVIDREGTVKDLRAIDSTSLSTSLIVAIRQAAPLGEVPDGAACIVGHSLHVSFSTAPSVRLEQ